MKNEQEISRIFHLIKNNPIKKEYFFRKLPLSKDLEQWYEYLNVNGYLDPCQNPKPEEDPEKKGFFKIPSWDVLEYILALAEKAGKDDITISEKILKFIDDVINYNINIAWVDNDRTHWMLFRILFTLPFNKLRLKHLQYLKKIILESQWDNILICDVIENQIIPIILKNYPNSEDFLKYLVSFLFEYKKSSKEYRTEYESIFQNYWLQKIMDRYRNDFACKLKNNGVQFAENKIREILKKDNEQFDLFEVAHINDDPQNEFLDRYAIQIIFFLRECLLQLSKDELHEITKRYLGDEYVIFKRLAFYLTDKKYDYLSSLLWDLGDNPLTYPNVKHELYQLFENHSNEFSEIEIQQVIGWIENNDYSYCEKEIHEFYAKKEWLFALRNNQSTSVCELYAKYDGLNPAKLDHPGHLIWHGPVTYGPDTESLPQDFFQKSNMVIAQNLNSISKDAIDDRYLSYGPGELFKRNILEFPDKYLSDLTPFIHVKEVFQNQIVRAFYEIWQNGKDFNWGNLFSFIEAIIEKIQIVEPEKTDRYNYGEWLVGSIANLMELGTKKDQHAFDIKYLDKCKNILLYLEQIANDQFNYIKDYATTYINSTRGKIYDAILNYSLRKARVLWAEKQDKFETEIKKLFDLKLDEKKDVVFFYTLGKYLINLRYLDEDWFNTNFNHVFYQNNNQLWEHTMSAYLFFATRVNQNIYMKLKETGNFAKALTYTFPDKNIEDRLVQMACIAYFSKWENLNEDSLLNRIIVEAQINKMHELVKFVFFYNKDSIQPDLEPLIMTELFPVLYSRIKALNNPEYEKELFPHLTKWVIFLKEFSPEELEIFEDLVHNLHDTVHKTIFLEKLSHFTTSAFAIGTLMKVLASNDERHPYYKEAYMLKIFNLLQKNGLQKDINEVCNLLIKKGLYRFKEINLKYQNE